MRRAACRGTSLPSRPAPRPPETLIGYVSAKAEQVVSYYFGSSAGSSRKDALLAQAPPIK